MKLCAQCPVTSGNRIPCPNYGAGCGIIEFPELELFCSCSAECAAVGAGARSKETFPNSAGCWLTFAGSNSAVPASAGCACAGGDVWNAGESVAAGVSEAVGAGAISAARTAGVGAEAGCNSAAAGSQLGNGIASAGAGLGAGCGGIAVALGATPAAGGAGSSGVGVSPIWGLGVTAVTGLA
jgi:hypothetical protein